MSTAVTMSRPQLDSIFATLSFDDMAWAIKNLTDRFVAVRQRTVKGRARKEFSMEELDRRLAVAEKEMADGKCITMDAEETGEQFLNRLLCI